MMPMYRLLLRLNGATKGKGFPVVLFEPSGTEAEERISRRMPDARIVDVCRVECGVESTYEEGTS